MIVSYAQNFEDVILWRALKHIERGFYIDIGAQDPVSTSVSLAFYEMGWRGVHVEPNAVYAKKLRLARSDEDVLEAAIGLHDGQVDFFEIADSGLSTGDRVIARAHEARGWNIVRRQVPCVRLSSVLDNYADRDIHWLKIDVEGMEEAVIESWRPSQVRPWILVVESTLPNSQTESHHDWEAMVISIGYNFVYFDGLNRFYVSTDHQELVASFGPGPNLFDEFKLADTSDFIHRLDSEASYATATAPEASATQLDALAAAEQAYRDKEAEWQAEREMLHTAHRSSLTAERDARVAAQQVYRDKKAEWQAEKKVLHTAHKISLAAERVARVEAEQAYKDKKVSWEAESRLRVAAEAHIAVERGARTAIEASRSWRITAPLRDAGTTVRWLGDGAEAWLKLRPGSRPHRVTRQLAIRLAQYILAKPRIADHSNKVVSLLPRNFKLKLKTFVSASTTMQAPQYSSRFSPEDVSQLSARSKEILNLLTIELDGQRAK